ncbi:hypothetical protein [Flavobacterium sp. J27]|uniref:hypothetical protein n=1 Tax=Flavobacterium sp. J27 TaxID=2060419 RepID=UPI001030F4C9|nr:hypothetical protein [Flavobacterium sp. J27]
MQLFHYVFLAVQVVEIQTMNKEEQLSNISTSQSKHNLIMRSSNDLDEQTKEALNISDFYKSESQETVNFINALDSQNINISNLNYDDINLMTFSNLEVELYSVSIKNSSEKLLAYKFEDNYAVLKSKDNNGFVDIKTIDNNNFINTSYIINESNNKLNVNQIFDNSVVNTFSNNVYDVLYSKRQASSEECCRHMSYTNCARCIVENIYGNSFWFMVGTYFVPELSAAMLISCIGSGPNSFC